MSFFRFILLVIVGIAVYWFWRWTMMKFDHKRRDHFKRSSNEAADLSKGKTSELVQDPVCKLYIAKSKAIEYKGRYFCSEKCKSDYCSSSSRT